MGAIISKNEEPSHVQVASHNFCQCAHSQRLKNVLQKYQRIMDGISSFESAIDIIFTDEYSVADLHNDFHHILDVHSINSDPLQFESCYEFMVNDDALESNIFWISTLKNW